MTCPYLHDGQCIKAHVMCPNADIECQYVLDFEAEAEQLKAEVEHAKKQLEYWWKEDSDELKAAKAEVERLKAQPTAAQERAEIVNYIVNTQRLRPMDDARSICHRLATKITIGEHWPTEGKP